MALRYSNVLRRRAAAGGPQSYVTKTVGAKAAAKLHKTGVRRREGDIIIRPYTYRLERVSCGKRRCGRCAGVKLAHGPYWYAYWREGQRTRSKYIGKKFRELPARREHLR